MKFIRSHITFIFPMMIILLGIEFFLAFDRVTDSYEKNLKEKYSIFVVSNEPMTLENFKSLNSHINVSEEIDKEALAKRVSEGMSQSGSEEILKELPYFYNIRLDSYFDVSMLKSIKEDIEKSKKIKSVEMFGDSHSVSYRLFSFIKLTFKIFVVFMALVSFFLVIRQMEIWNYEHKERMRVMEIFGAPFMLRSGVLYRVAVVDAIISTLLTSGIFLYFKYYWAQNSQINILMLRRDQFFQSSDLLILLGTALTIVIFSVYFVVLGTKDKD